MPCRTEGYSADKKCMASGSKYGSVFLDETIQFQTLTQYALNKSNMRKEPHLQ